MKNIAVIGASGTIGSSVAELLNQKGHAVLKVSRNSEHKMDMDNPNSIIKFFADSIPLDAIICCAGMASFGAFASLSEEQIQLGIKSKLLGQVNICKEGLKVLKPNGVIILTGGIFAHQPWPETSNIAMANAGLEGFVKALSLELDSGQRILIVHPPLVKETAVMMGITDDNAPSAMEVAQTYVNGLEGNENGTALYVESKQIQHI